MITLPFFAKKQAASNKFLSIDINASCIRTLAFFQEESTLKVVGSCVFDLEPYSVRGNAIVDFDNVELVLHENLVQLQNTIGEEIKEVVFNVAGGMCLDFMTTARISREKPQTTIGEREIAGIQKRILQAAENEVGNELLQTIGNADLDMTLVGTTVAYSKIDSKLVEKPLDMTGKEIELGIFTAYSPRYHINMLKKLIGKLKLKERKIISQTYALVQALNTTKSTKKDCVVINIGSDFTDVAVVFGGGIVATRTLPIANWHFVEEIGQKMGLTRKEAEKIKATYAAGNLALSENRIVQHCLNEALQTWLSGVELLFAEFTGVKTFASEIYVFGEGSMLPDVIEMLNREPWTKTIAFKSPPEIKQLNINDIKGAHDSTGMISTQEWIAPYCAALVKE